MPHGNYLQNIEAFCGDADGLYYSDPHELHGDIAFVANVDTGWRTTYSNGWTHCSPPPDAAHRPPDQGWKIHISSVPEQCEDALRIISAYCVAAHVHFKYLPDRGAFSRANAKYAPRNSSGKFITIYPRPSQLHEILNALESMLSSFDGPYILSDVRWGSAPVFLRYGGFVRRMATLDGVVAHTITDAGGRLAEDQRLPYFVPPEAGRIPEFLKASISKRVDADDETLPFIIDTALHFSNCGGVYVARRSDDLTEVVLKEARAHVAVDRNGDDAAARLGNEYRALVALASVDGVADAYRLLTVGDHTFMEMEYIHGVSLYEWVAANYPYSERFDVADYAAQAVRIGQSLAAIVERVHGVGIAITDLQPRNIMIGDDLAVSLIDFELAMPLLSDNVRTMATPGFIPRLRCSRQQQDRYALMRTIVHMFSPLTPLPALTDEIWIRQRAFILQVFGPEIAEWVGLLDGNLGGPLSASVTHDRESLRVSIPGAGAESAQQLTSELVDGIVRSRRSEGDHPYPGGPHQFDENGGVNIANGSLGVELMLSRHMARPGRQAHTAAANVAAALETSDYSLLFGRLGMSCALHEMGLHRELVGDLIADVALDSLDVGLGDGLAGIALGLYSLCRTGYTAADAPAARAMKHLEAASYTQLDSEAPRPGLFDGLAGAAVALALVLKHSGRDGEKYRKLVVQLLDRAIAQLVEAPDGSLQVRQNGNFYPYLGSGSAGVGLAVAICAKTGVQLDDSLSSVLERIRLACAVRTCLCPGLLDGMAGLVLADRHMAAALGMRGSMAPAAKFDMFTFIDAGGGMMTSGYGSRRLVADYSTGSAGVLAALAPDLTMHSWLPIAHPDEV
ncbi:class III lanthionine synthetase LanKC [Nocardia suismassiliense]|uniref:Class III lanthionine synthetase LanKC n=1 Tax=Nocardia suismassiliense TaxID=2077092 RepID=A0ABW6QWQ1_9NOCA